MRPGDGIITSGAVIGLNWLRLDFFFEIVRYWGFAGCYAIHRVAGATRLQEVNCMRVVGKALLSGAIVAGGVLGMGSVAFAAGQPTAPPTGPPAGPSCPKSLTSCESLLAYVGSESAGEPTMPGVSGTVYYEDETAIYSGHQSMNGSVPSLTLTWKQGKTEHTDALKVHTKSLYAGTEVTTAESKLTKQFKAYNLEYGGSGPNAASQSGLMNPYISELTYKLPMSLTSNVSYKATLHVWDSDGNQDQISWKFNIPSSSGTPIAPLFGGDSVEIAGALMAAAGGVVAVAVHRRRTARSALSR